MSRKRKRSSPDGRYSLTGRRHRRAGSMWEPMPVRAGVGRRQGQEGCNGVTARGVEAA